MNTKKTRKDAKRIVVKTLMRRLGILIDRLKLDEGGLFIVIETKFQAAINKQSNRLSNVYYGC